MAARSRIEWTHRTWNPTTGCTKISPGCAHCYAQRMAARLQSIGQRKYANAFRLTLHEDLLDAPLQWKRPHSVFVNSMGDLFHKDVPVEFIMRVFDVMRRAHQHRFQVLTKRSERLLELSPILPWPPNIWAGVTVENSDYAYRIDHLRKTGAAIKFLSIEPLLGPLPGLDLEGIDWVLVGGESGPCARPVDAAWVIDIRDQCLAAGVAFFFKQWGGVDRRKTGRILEGRTWDDMPAACSAPMESEPTLPGLFG